MTVDIICPLYQAEDYISKLHQTFLNQKDVNIRKIHYVLTKSSDHSESILKEMKLDYELIEKQDFSHSLVREKAAMESKADIICFVSQDIVIDREDWLKNLISPIVKGLAEASYSRQLTKFNNIEKYTREANYGDQSLIKSKADLEKMGLKTFFFSDASSAIKRSVFVDLHGYDGKYLPINEDMYFAYKLIMNGYRIAYQADSVVYHSHNFKLKELYQRYKLTGQFFKENFYIDQFETTKSGGGLAKYILKRSVQDKNLKVLIRYPFEMIVRFVGMKVGKL